LSNVLIAIEVISLYDLNSSRRVLWLERNPGCGQQYCGPWRLSICTRSNGEFGHRRSCLYAQWNWLWHGFFAYIFIKWNFCPFHRVLIWTNLSRLPSGYVRKWRGKTSQGRPVQFSAEWGEINAKRVEKIY
jgi:hypothetical protein